jgi:hypothetical protein
MAIEDEIRRAKLLQAIKPQVDTANTSTVCDKREVEEPVGLFKLNIPRAAWILLCDVLGNLIPKRKVKAT